MSDCRSIFESHYTWIEGFMRNVRRYGEKLAMINPDDERQWTYTEMNKECNRLSNALINDGLQKADVIMLQLINCPEFAFGYLAAHKSHAICCPVNFRLKPGELAFNIDDSKPIAIIFNEVNKADVLDALKLTKHQPKKLIVVGGASDNQVVSYEDYTRNASDAEPKFDYDYNIYDETTRLYTSGTTGFPKAVPLTSINEVLSVSSRCDDSFPYELQGYYDEHHSLVPSWRFALCRSLPCFLCRRHHCGNGQVQFRTYIEICRPI